MSNSTGKTQISQQGGAESGALDRLVAAWDDLPPAIQDEILRLADVL